MIDFAAALWPFVTLMVTAFLAGTLLPFSSEAALAVSLKAELGSPAGLLAAATIGNVGGSLFNWWVGRHALHFQERRWFPFTPPAMEAASTRFRNYGSWTLLLSWVPLIGDPLTFMAGVFRVPLWTFLPLVTAGKLGRYFVVFWAFNGA